MSFFLFKNESSHKTLLPARQRNSRARTIRGQIQINPDKNRRKNLIVKQDWELKTADDTLKTGGSPHIMKKSK